MNNDNAIRTNFKTLIAGAVVFGLVVLTYQQGINFIETAGGGSLNARMLAMLDYLPEMTAEAESDDVVMVFGSSMVQAGFDPQSFDAALSETGVEAVSYNFGVGNLNPRFQKFLSERIRETFDEADQEIELALIEFNPFQTTVARNEMTRPMDEQNFAVLMSPHELWHETLDDPSRGTRMFVIRYLRKGYSAELITSLPTLASSPDESGMTSTDEYRAANAISQRAGIAFFESAAADLGPNSGQQAWDASLRGGRTDGSRLSERTLTLLETYTAARQHPMFMQRDLARRVQQTDILQLGFDETLIEAFIDIVEDFQAVSRNVEVVLLPRNTDYVIYTPDVQAKLDAVRQRISTATGVTVRDFQVHPAITPDDFVDSTHLGYLGAVEFSRLLAEEYAETIR